MSPRLVGIATGVCLSQVGHAARVGIHVLSVAAAGPVSVCVVPGGAVLNAGLTGVGRAVVEDLGAAAALCWGEHQGRHASFRFRRELGLRLQATAALAEMLRCILAPGIKTCFVFFLNRIWCHSHARTHTTGAADGAEHLREGSPQLGAAEGVAGKDRGGGHAAGVTWLPGSHFERAVVAR